MTDLSQRNVWGGGGCCSCLNERGRALMRRFRTASDLGWLLGTGSRVGGHSMYCDIGTFISCTAKHTFIIG